MSGAEFTRDLSELIRGAPDSRTVTSPNSLTVVREYAFERAVRLVSVVLNEGLEEICEGAFSSSGLRRIVLPQTLTKMAQDAFPYCAELKTISSSKTLSTASL